MTMRTYTKVVHEGEPMGPIDWDHPIAKNVPDHWKDAEKEPERFVYGEWGKRILMICMYDGWPYWKPTPAIFYEGPLGGEWAFFNSYGASINPRSNTQAVRTE